MVGILPAITSTRGGIGKNWGATYSYVNPPAENENWGSDSVDTWMDTEFNPGPTVVPAESGFWYSAKNPGVTLTFGLPAID